MLKIWTILILSSLSFSSLYAQDIYLTRKGNVIFISEAPLEIISAESDELFGAVDLSNNRFAFKISTRSLKGFNSALQQEHFYENYIEVDKYRYSTFEGKIIELINDEINLEQYVRAKGILSIHGVEQERIINVKLVLLENAILINAEFEVLLEDYNIRIPSIVNQKISDIISVKVSATLLPKSN